MPSSKEVRARQNRQKERVAAQRAERQRIRQRRRRLGGAVGVIVLVIVVVLGLTLGGGSNNRVAVSPTSETPTTAATATTVVASVKGKPCIGMKDPLPKGSPAFLIAPGPAPTKLATQDLTVGTGALVPKNAKVSMNYVGVACSTGKIFDTSFKTGRTPFDADLSPTASLIAGWKQGIPGMKIGGVRLLSIPPALAYGAAGNSGIAPDEALFFLVQAVKLG
ncbi:MAG: FKBP-type peptidyl-prolyl cis-trans isomerase [Actinomycetia bacterium]|jgi:peptidylprolyl isomerase|nr:FKBP-type peptidyl-prolyl cis-trans isomerase [Actinomycetes bacterium]